MGSDLGVATGLAFAPDGSLFVGDRSGTIFRIDGQGRTETVASLPGSMAAFHLAFGPDGWLYVSAPTLSTYDLLRRVDASGRVETLDWVFGRPQGLAFDRAGVLHVVEALAGASGVYALRPGGRANSSCRARAWSAWRSAPTVWWSRPTRPSTGSTPPDRPGRRPGRAASRS